MLREEVTASEKRRREVLFGTCGVLFVHLAAQEDRDDDARDRILELIEHMPKR